jgi:serine/threonine protein kinase
VKGKILGSRYQVLEYIAEGGFGKTYLAEDTQLPGKDLCIVKQLAPSFNSPKLLEIARRLFKTEATALHSLGHHPQIPELLAYFEEAEKFYLVQQYIAGQTLEQKLKLHQPWSATQVIELLRDCLNVLRFIHDKGVIHRDLKPANLILRNTDNKIVLVDFGSVKNILQGQGSLEQLTVAVGTQGYMPIEQARGKPNSTSDLYALGAIGIQALTGIKPLDLDEDENGEIIWSHLVDTTPELRQILTKMTRYSYRERYQSAQLVLDALNSCDDTVVTKPQIKSNVNQRMVPSLLPTNQRQGSSNINQESNALPGIRSVSMVTNRPPRPVQTKRRAKQSVWKIGLIGLAVAGGIFLFIQQFMPQPASNDDANQQAIPGVTPQNN